MQKGTSSQAIRTVASGRGIAHAQAAIAIDGIVGLISKGGVINAKLRIVEEIEDLHAELDGRSFLNSPVLEKRHIRVKPQGIAQYVPPGIPEGKTTRCAESSGIQQERPNTFRIVPSERKRSMRISAQVGIRPGPASVRDTGVIQRRNAIRASDVDYSERSSSLKCGDA
jgi:hypothetical protein